MTPESLSGLLEDFLGGPRHASVLEDGARIFDLANSKYTCPASATSACCISGPPSATPCAGYWTPSSAMEIFAWWSSAAGKPGRQNSKSAKAPTIARPPPAGPPGPSTSCICAALERHLPGFTIAKLSNAMDLERSFGPIYARGVVARAAPPSPCSASTSRRPSPPSMPPFGILWLDACRHSADPRTPFEGLKRFLPAGTSALTRERLAHLDPGAAKWHLYEFDERHDALVQLDFADRGNVDTRLDPMKRQPSIASPTPFSR